MISQGVYMKKVIILGAGYGGLRAMESLANNPAFSITLIDQHPYHYMQTEAYGYIAGRFDISDIAIDLQSFCDGFAQDITFLQTKAVDIDTEKKELILENKTLTYDYLIVSVGAQTNFFSFIKGAQEHSHGVKNIQRAFEFRQAFEKRLYHKLENHKLNRDGDLHIAIAGAGLSGVEIAAEMAYTLKRYKKILSKNSLTLTISLIDAAPTILPGMEDFIIQKTKKRLKELGVQIYTETFIKEVKSRDILFSDDTQMPFDFLIYTAGIKASDFIEKLPGEKNKIGQIIPDDYLRIKEHEDIFVIGDCVQLQNQDKEMLPPTAQMAERSASYVAKQIIHRESNHPLIPFDCHIDGVFVALGGKYAVGMLYKKVKLSGYIAYIMKKVLTRLYRFGLELKVNVGYKSRD